MPFSVTGVEAKRASRKGNEEPWRMSGRHVRIPGRRKTWEVEQALENSLVLKSEIGRKNIWESERRPQISGRTRENGI